MPKCTICRAKYSFWAAKGDGLCAPCRAEKGEAEKREWAEIEKRENAEANQKIAQLLNELAPNQEWSFFGIGLWSRSVSKASKTADLWVARATIGILADMLNNQNPEPSLVSILAVTKTNQIFAVKLVREQTYITTELIQDTSLDRNDFTCAPIHAVSVTYSGQKLFLDDLPNGKRFELTFPKCFIEGNEEVPKRLTSLKDALSNTKP